MLTRVVRDFARFTQTAFLQLSLQTRYELGSEEVSITCPAQQRSPPSCQAATKFEFIRRPVLGPAVHSTTLRLHNRILTVTLDIHDPLVSGGRTVHGKPGIPLALHCATERGSLRASLSSTHRSISPTRRVAPHHRVPRAACSIW
ncbi:hypothetical protein J6590_049034, partial [Homalodisca vitripennis]